MALSTRTKTLLKIALADNTAGSEVASAVDTGGNPVAAVVAALGSTTNVPAAAITTAGGNTYSDVSTNAGINGVVTAVEARLDAIEAKVDAVILALKNAGLMATS